jgi:hypothetical protein
LKILIANDTKPGGVFVFIREKDGFHPIISVAEELNNAFTNRMKRIQEGTREEKKENLKKQYFAFERKMMYVIALAAIQKSKEWNEEITLLLQLELGERFSSMQEQLHKAL